MINNEEKNQKMKNIHVHVLHLHEINLFINVSMTTLNQLTISKSIL